MIEMLTVREPELRDIAVSGRDHRGLVEIVLRITQIRREPGDRRVDAAHIGGEGKPRATLSSFSFGDCLLRRIEIASRGIERRLCYIFGLEELCLPVIGGLRQRKLRLGLFKVRRSLIERSLELLDVLFSFGECRLLLLHDELVGRRVELEQRIALPQRHVRLDRHLTTRPLTCGTIAVVKK